MELDIQSLILRCTKLGNFVRTRSYCTELCLVWIQSRLLNCMGREWFERFSCYFDWNILVVLIIKRSLIWLGPFWNKIFVNMVWEVVSIINVDLLCFLQLQIWLNCTFLVFCPISNSTHRICPVCQNKQKSSLMWEATASLVLLASLLELFCPFDLWSNCTMQFNWTCTTTPKLCFCFCTLAFTYNYQSETVFSHTTAAEMRFLSSCALTTHAQSY